MKGVFVCLSLNQSLNAPGLRGLMFMCAGFANCWIAGGSHAWVTFTSWNSFLPNLLIGLSTETKTRKHSIFSVWHEGKVYFSGSRARAARQTVRKLQCRNFIPVADLHSGLARPCSYFVCDKLLKEKKSVSHSKIYINHLSLLQEQKYTLRKIPNRQINSWSVTITHLREMKYK